MEYYPIARNWTAKAVPHLGDAKLNRTLVRDFNRYTSGLWRKPFKAGMFPDQFENMDWRWSRRGPHPRFWKYVKSGACFWLVNFNLRLAQLAEPGRPWRVVWSDKHATVWDGDRTLFDLNFVALNVSVEECWSMANVNHEPVGREYRCGRPDYCMSEIAKRNREAGKP